MDINDRDRDNLTPIDGESSAQNESSQAGAVKKWFNNVWFMRIFVAIGAISVLCVAVFTGLRFWEIHEAKKLDMDIRELFFTEETPEPNPPTDTDVMPPSLDAFLNMQNFDQLLTVNDETIGWIYIPDTNINNVVVKGGNNKYYLSYTFYGTKSKYGTVFMDYRNALPFQDNTIIYGHNMRDDRMFGDLMKYKKAQFYNEHSIIYLKTAESVTKWKIFSVYVTSTDFYYIVNTFKNNVGLKQRFIDEVCARSLLECDVDVTPEDKIITLSTCDYTIKDGRFAVHARLLREGEDLEVNAAVQRDPKLIEKRRNDWVEAYNEERNAQ